MDKVTNELNTKVCITELDFNAGTFSEEQLNSKSEQNFRYPFFNKRCIKTKYLKTPAKLSF